jgi:hypothetical protein
MFQFFTPTLNPAVQCSHPNPTNTYSYLSNIYTASSTSSQLLQTSASLSATQTTSYNNFLPTTSSQHQLLHQPKQQPATMCYRVIEIYAVCRCVYYVHGVDQCGAYGLPGHHVEDRTLLVGHTCPQHASGYSNSRSNGRPHSIGQVIPDTYGADSFGASYNYRSHR